MLVLKEDLDMHNKTEDPVMIVHPSFPVAAGLLQVKLAASCRLHVRSLITGRFMSL